MSRTTPLRSVATVSDSATNSNELCKAILDADIKKVEELIKNGIDVNEKSSDGYSPLCIAAFWGYADIAKMLLEAKADVNATNKGTGWTPIHCAAFQGHGNVIRHLIEHQLDLTIKDSSGRMAVDFASAREAIWPFFSFMGCQRTPKENLINLEIIQKVQPDESNGLANRSNRSAARYQSRPGSSYVLADPQHNKDNAIISSHAKEYGDVLHEES